jgi:hypothetical protein
MAHVDPGHKMREHLLTEPGVLSWVTSSSTKRAQQRCLTFDDQRGTSMSHVARRLSTYQPISWGSRNKCFVKKRLYKTNIPVCPSGGGDPAFNKRQLRENSDLIAVNKSLENY